MEDKATDKKCYFYSEKEENNCEALRFGCFCKNCKFFKSKKNIVNHTLMKQYRIKQELLYYPNGTRR
jgi:hypothetical protein